MQRAASVCDRLLVAIGANSEKSSPLFSVDERIDMIQEMTRALPHVKVCAFSGLVVDFCREQEAHFMLRGIRAFSDLEYEYRMGCANRTLGGLETVFLLTDERYVHISSSLIRDIGRCGGELRQFVPEAILERVQERLSAVAS
jgi:pantetheine-phosphate adenylyltransferase